MHYIRFLKLPKFTASKASSNKYTDVVAKITCTNDLGELFLTTALSLGCILLVHLSRTQKQQHVYQYEWQPYARALDINFTILSKYLRDANGKALTCELVVQCQKPTNVGGRIVGIYSEVFGLSGGTTTTVKRILPMNGHNTMVIREEKGESIARHIWDAGLVLAELLHSMSHDTSGIALQLPRCSAALRRWDLRAIELGTGVGLVGLSLADVLSRGDHGSACVLLTDLDDAREIVEMNMAERPRKDNVVVEFSELDWTEALPASVQSEYWDVVLVADCTYNPDYAEALASTIKRLLSSRESGKVSGDRTPVALLAMKPRHSAENVFFEYMEQAGMQILEEVSMPLPVLGGESQEIRILGFGLK